MPWHSMPGARAIGTESSRARSKSNVQSSGAKASSKKQVPSLMLQAREDSVSIALALDAGCKSNVQSSCAKASSKKQIPSLMPQAREDSVSIALALDAVCKGNLYRVLTSKEQVHRAIFGCVLPQAQTNKSHPLFGPLRMPCPYGFGCTLILMRRQ